MSDKLMRGMAQAQYDYWVKKLGHGNGGPIPEDIEAMRAALLHLADELEREPPSTPLKFPGGHNVSVAQIVAATLRQVAE